MSYNHSQVGLPSSIADLQNLRILRLKDCRIFKELPGALGKLRHLRYLDLSENGVLEVLPNSITELHNLQTLKLQHCRNLKELPEDFSNLVNLKVLDIDHMIRRMARGIGKLRYLQKLPLFVVGDETSTLKQNIVDQMEDLRALTRLRGSLCIRILKNTEYVKGIVSEGGYLLNKEHLTHLRIQFSDFHREDSSSGVMGEEERRLLLQHLQPHSNLKQLRSENYRGIRIWSWAWEDDLATVLPNLTQLQLWKCRGLQHLPSLTNLWNLKALELRELFKLEYMENGTGAGIMSDGMGASRSQPFFPSLQQLRFTDMPQLKRWWREDEFIDGDSNQVCRLFTSFPTLRELAIWNCLNFTCDLTCLALEELVLMGEINEELRITIPIEIGIPKLRKVRTRNAGCLKTAMPIEAFQCLREMEIRHTSEIASLSEIEGVFRSCSSSLQKLEIQECPRLESVRGGLHHLTALKELKFWDLPNLNVGNTQEREGEGEGEREEDGMPWCSLHHSLGFLEIRSSQDGEFAKGDALPHFPQIPEYLVLQRAGFGARMDAATHLPPNPKDFRLL